MKRITILTFKNIRLRWIIIATTFLLLTANAFSQTILVDGTSVLVSDQSKFPFWLKDGQTLAIETNVISISVIEYNVVTSPSGGNVLTLERVVKVTTVQTIAANKAWKVEAVLLDPALTGGNNGSGWVDDGTVVRLATATDNVGIGNISPSHQLQVGTTSSDAQAVTIRGYSNSPGSWKGGAAFGYATGSVIMGELNGIPQIGGQNAALNGWSDLAINSGGGNVGIGTTTPQQSLDLGNGTGGRSLVWSGGGGAWYSTIGTSYSSGSTNVLSGLKLNTTIDQTLRSYTGTIAAAGTRWELGTGDIYFFNSPSAAQTAGTLFDYTANTKMIIKSSGYVGIGNTVPLASLDIKGIGNTSATYGLGVRNSADAYSLVVRDDGNVGIGTIPNAALDVSSTTQGFAMPRMTSAQRKAIVSPIDGLQVYDTNLKGYYYFNGTKWDCVSVPAGTVNYFANSTAPTGYLICNAQAVSRTTYAELFAAIGTTYGVGNGSTTFNLPELRGEFIRGLDASRGVDVGRAIGTAQAATGIADQVYQTVTLFYDNPDGATYGATWYNSSGGYAGFGRTFNYFKVRPRNVALLPCIKF